MFYSDGHTTSYEELLSYYPVFYREVLEMRAILEANGRKLDDSAQAISRVLDNAFIDTADNETIERLERFLRITPNAANSYEDRRRNVKLYFTGFGKISATKLKGMLFPFTETEATITFAPNDEDENNMLSISVPRGNNTQFSYLDLMDFLSRRIPAHLWFRVDFIHTHNPNLFYGFVTITLQELEIGSDDEELTSTT